MLISLVFGLILGGITVIFAIQNVVPINVTFLAWEIEGSLALVLLAAALSGAIIAALLSIPEIIRDRSRFKAVKNQNKDLTAALEASKARIVELENKLPQQQSSPVIY